MFMDYEQLKNLIVSYGDENKRLFDQKVLNTKLPNYGVKTLTLRKLAKMIADDDFSNYPYYDSYEEALTVALAMAYSKRDLDCKLDFFFEFYKRCDTWALVDSVVATLNLKKISFAEIKNKLARFLKSPDTFVHRFAVIVFLDHYLEYEYLSDVFDLISDSEDYYVMMAEAWLLATAYAKYPQITYDFLQKTKLNSNLRKNILRKIKDSYRVSAKNKEIIASVLR